MVQPWWVCEFEHQFEKLVCGALKTHRGEGGLIQNEHGGPPMRPGACHQWQQACLKAGESSVAILALARLVQAILTQGVLAKAFYLVNKLFTSAGPGIAAEMRFFSSLPALAIVFVLVVHGEAACHRILPCSACPAAPRCRLRELGA